MWIQSRSIQNHRSQINTSVSLNELKFLYLSTKVSLLLNLTGSRKWSSALQTKKKEKIMSILGTWILRTWLYANYVFSLFHPLQEVDFLNKIIMSSHNMTCTSKYDEKITCVLHQKKDLFCTCKIILFTMQAESVFFVLDAWSYFYHKL